MAKTMFVSWAAYPKGDVRSLLAIGDGYIMKSSYSRANLEAFRLDARDKVLANLPSHVQPEDIIVNITSVCILGAE